MSILPILCSTCLQKNFTVINMKHINDMTRKELLATPMKSDPHAHTKCDSFVIIPTGKKHESGYGEIAIIACDDKGLPICKTIDYADDINLIVYDRYEKYGNPKSMVPQEEILHTIRIDCLPKSKALHIWGHGSFDLKSRTILDLGSSGSSYDIRGYPSGRQ